MTDWNDCYRQGETPWEKGMATPVLDEVMARHPSAFRGRVLVPGCGLGHDAGWLAERGMQATAVDIAPLAIEQARALDTAHRVEFVLASLFDLPQELRGAFDLVWEHTCLCALPLDLRTAYARGVASALKPGGVIAGVFFLNPEMDPGETGPPFGIEVEELHRLWREVGYEPVDSWVPTTGYEGRVGRELAMVLRKSKGRGEIVEQG